MRGKDPNSPEFGGFAMSIEEELRSLGKVTPDYHAGNYLEIREIALADYVRSKVAEALEKWKYEPAISVRQRSFNGFLENRIRELREER